MIDLEIKTYVLGLFVGATIAILYFAIENFLIACVITSVINVLIVVLIAHRSVKEENKCLQKD